MALNQCSRCGQFRGASHRCLPKRARGAVQPLPGVTARAAQSPAGAGARTGGVGADYSSLYAKFQQRAVGDSGVGLSTNVDSSPVGASPVVSGDAVAVRVYQSVDRARVVLSTPDSSGAPFHVPSAGGAIDEVVRGVRSGSGSSRYAPAVFSADTYRDAGVLAGRTSSGPAGMGIPDYFVHNPATGGFHYLKPEVAGFLQRVHQESAAAARGVQQRFVGASAGVRAIRVSPAAV